MCCLACGQTQLEHNQMKTDKDWKEILSPEAYHILRERVQKEHFRENMISILKKVFTFVQDVLWSYLIRLQNLIHMWLAFF